MSKSLKMKSPKSPTLSFLLGFLSWCLALGAFNASAATDIVNNLGNVTADTTFQNVTGQLAAQAFMTDDQYYKLDSMTVTLANLSGGTSTAGVSLCKDDDGLPGAPLETIYVISFSSSANVNYKVNSTTRPILAPNTRYWVMVSRASGSFKWTLTSNTASSGPGTVLANDAISPNSGASWSTPTANNYNLSVRANTFIPNLAVTGGGMTIVHGDSATSTAKDTDYGSVAVSSGTVSHTFTIQNTGATSLTLGTVTTTGTDFTVTSQPAATLTAGASTTFTVAFDPTATGLRTTTVSIPSNDADENPFTFDLRGFGAGPGAPDELDTMAGTGITSVIAMQPDGKTLIAYKFDSILGEPRKNIARLNADGTLDASFNPDVSSFVTTLALLPNGQILIGGLFNTVGGTARKNIARLNADGSLDNSFTPEVDADGNDFIGSLILQPDGKILLGGAFTSVNGVPRNRIARLHADGSLDLDFNPNANHTVNGLTLQPDGKILACGQFTAFQPNGAPTPTTRNYLARLNADGTLDTAFNPNPNVGMYSITLQPDGKILPCGVFNSICDTPRTYFARLHADGSLDTDFNPLINSGVICANLQADGKILIGGHFTSVNGTTRRKIARLGADGSLDPAFDPNADGYVDGIALQENGEILMGGAFNRVGNLIRRFARLDNEVAINTLTVPDATQVLWTRGGAAPLVYEVTFEHSKDGGNTWLPLGNGSRVGTSASWEITGLALTGNGQLRARGRTLGGLSNSSAGIVEDIGAYDFSVREIALSGNGIDILNGNTTPSTTDHTDFGSVSTSSGTLTRTFTVQNSGPDPLTLGALTFSGPAAAEFSVTTPPVSPVASGSSTTFTITFDPATTGLRQATLSLVNNDGDENPFTFALQGTGLAPEIAVYGNGNVIANGSGAPDLDRHMDFGTTGMGSGTLTRTYTIQNSGNGSLTVGTITFSGNAAADFSVTVPPASSVAAGGSTTFTVTFAPTATGLRNAIVAIPNNDTDEAPYTFSLVGTGTGIGSVDSPEPVADNPVNVVALQPDGKILLGGEFSSILNGNHNRIARLNQDGTLDQDFNAQVSGSITSLALQSDGKILLAGRFVTVNGATHSRIARLNQDGSLDTGFNPQANGDALGVMVQADGKILIGGTFTAVNGTPRSRIARLHSDGSLDLDFHPQADDAVGCITVQPDNKILIGGIFYTVDGSSRIGIARLNPDGTLDEDFNPMLNGYLMTLVVQPDGKILLGGGFTSVGGVTRNRIARLHSDGVLDTDFNPNANDRVDCLALQADGKILLGGLFTSLGGTARNYIARLSAAGALDPGFNPNANGDVVNIAIQADGKIILSGGFNIVGGILKNHYARLSNDPATQTLSLPGNSPILWTRGGTAPDVTQVSFENSIDGGATWNLLGFGTRVENTADWQLAVPLPGSGLLRARGRSIGGSSNGSSGIVESQVNYSGLLTLVRSVGSMELSWPMAESTGLTVQSTASLSGTPVWVTEDIEPTIVGDRYQVVIPVGSENRYFRLITLPK